MTSCDSDVIVTSQYPKYRRIRKLWTRTIRMDHLSTY